MKRNLQVLSYLALLFAAGMGVGALGHRFLTVGKVSANAPRPRSPEEFRKLYTEEMKTRLVLSTDQVQRLSVILDGTGSRMHELRERMRPEMKAIQDDQVEQINGILSAQQQAEYAKMRKEREARREKMEKGGGR